MVVGALANKYDGTTVHLRGQEALGVYQSLTRVGGFALLAAVMASLLGMIRSRGDLRLAILLFGLSGFGLYLLPVLTLSYDFRYGIPAETLVVVSGLLGALSLGRRIAERGANRDDATS